MIRFHIGLSTMQSACCAGGSRPSPTVMEFGAIEFVGAIINRPCGASSLFTLDFRQKIQSSRPVILSERSESKDLGSIGGAKILRLPLVAQDDIFLRLCVFTLDFQQCKVHTVRAINDRPYMIGRTALESLGARKKPTCENRSRSGF